MINYPGLPTSSVKVPPGTMPANGTAAWAKLNV